VCLGSQLLLITRKNLNLVLRYPQMRKKQREAGPIRRAVSFNSALSFVGPGCPLILSYTLLLAGCTKGVGSKEFPRLKSPLH